MDIIYTQHGMSENESNHEYQQPKTPVHEARSRPTPVVFLRSIGYFITNCKIASRVGRLVLIMAMQFNKSPNLARFVFVKTRRYGLPEHWQSTELADSNE